MKEENIIKNETLFLIYGMLILSALMESVFIICGYWSAYVFLGNIIGAAVSVGNFYIMALTIKKAVTETPDDAKKRMKVSQQSRNLLVFVVYVLAASLTVFDVIPDDQTTSYIVSLILPLLFNRILIAIRARNVLE